MKKKILYFILFLSMVSFTSIENENSGDIHMFLSNYKKKYSVARTNRNIFELATWNFLIKDKLYSNDSLGVFIREVDDVEFEKFDTTKTFLVFGCVVIIHEGKKHIFYLLQHGKVIYKDKYIESSEKMNLLLNRYIPNYMLPDNYKLTNLGAD